MTKTSPFSFNSLVRTIAFLSIVPSILNAGPYLNVKPIMPAIHHAQEAEKRHGIPENLLTAIAHVESKCTPYAVNARGRGHYFSSKEQASKFIHELRAEGVRNINVGYMQLNLPSHLGRFKSIDDMLDIKRNIDFAAALLKKLYRIYGSWERAVERYKSSFSSSSKAYQVKVYGLRTSLKLPRASGLRFHADGIESKNERYHFTAYQGSLHYVSHNLKHFRIAAEFYASKKQGVPRDIKILDGKDLVKKLYPVTFRHFVKEGHVTNLRAWGKTYDFSGGDFSGALSDKIEKDKNLSSKTHFLKILGFSPWLGSGVLGLQVV